MFHVEGISDVAGRNMFCVVVKNVEIENIDRLISRIMEGKYEYYTSLDEPHIHLDYMVFVNPRFKAGDGLMPWAKETFDTTVKKHVSRLQDEFMRSSISSVNE